jgi:oligosaccharide repeat unit polymerase
MHVIASLLGAACFSVSSVIMYSALNIQRKIYNNSKRNILSDSRSSIVATVVLFLVSVIVTLIYYNAVGFNMISFLVAPDAQGSYSSMRLSTYAGDTYYGAGYVNQFKNVLLPLTSALISYWLYGRNRRLFVCFVIPVTLFNLFALMGTGQRTYLVLATLSLLFGFLLLSKGSRFRVFNYKSTIVLAGVVGIFVLMTGAYQTSGGTIGDMIFFSLRRIFFAQQWAGLEAFRYIYYRPNAWFQEWFQSMAGLLPGNRGSSLANEIHAIMFGSLKGTAPPTVVGSAYHNGGLLGVAIFFTIIGVAYAAVYSSYLTSPRTAARTMTYGAIFLYLVTYLVGSPRFMFDNGVFTLFILLAIYGPARSTRRRAEVRPFI